jgi:hypothetical protein
MGVTVAAMLLVPGITMAKQNGKPVQGSWTIALYVDADNDLEMYWDSPSLEYLLNIPESNGLKIVAFVDRLSVPGTERIEISGGNATVVDTYPEQNFGDGATFQWFLDEVEANYSSDHIVVIPWDHGSAWRGFCYDQSSGNDRITLAEMGDAIEGAGVYIDILAFDACSCSSMEVAYEAASTGLVELLVASEELVAGDGFPYDLMFTPVAEDSSKTAEDVARDMLAGWVAVYEPLVWAWYSTLGIVDLRVIAETGETISTWVADMTAGLPTNIKSYREALRDSYYVSCGSHYQVDMVDLGRHLMEDPLLVPDEELMASTSAMMTAIENAVIDVYNPEKTAACGGVSIYWGSHSDYWRLYYESYCSLDFAVDSGWGEFLVLYNTLSCGWTPEQ